MCHNPKSNCQKQITNFSLKENRIKNTMKKIIMGCQTAWNKFLKPAVNVAARFFGMALSAKTKNPKVGAATTIILKRKIGGKILSPTDMHGGALRLKVM